MRAEAELVQPDVAISSTSLVDSLPCFRLSEQQILKAIENLDDDKGPGLDGISNFFIKQAAAGLVIPLLMVFNASLVQGVFPNIFKETMLHPIFKAGDRSDVTNYRPVAILNAF